MHARETDRARETPVCTVGEETVDARERAEGVEGGENVVRDVFDRLVADERARRRA